MSDMEDNSAAMSSITSINNEQQDDVQPTPEPLAKVSIASFADPREVLDSAPGLNRNEPPTTPGDITRPNEGVFTVLPGQKHNVQTTTLRDNASPNEQEPEGKVHGVLNLVAILLGTVCPEKLIDIVSRQVASLWNQEGCSPHRYRTSEYVPKVKKIIEKLSRGYRLDDIIFAEKDLVFLRQLLEHILDSEIISSSLDAKNVSTSSCDAVLEALLEPAPCHSRANANLPTPITEEDKCSM